MNLRTVGFKERKAWEVKDGDTIMHFDEPRNVITSTYKHRPGLGDVGGNPNHQRIMSTRRGKYFDQTLPDDHKVLVWVGYSKWVWVSLLSMIFASAVVRSMESATGAALAFLVSGTVVGLIIWEQHVRQVPRPWATILISHWAILNLVAFLAKVGSL